MTKSTFSFSFTAGGNCSCVWIRLQGCIHFFPSLIYLFPLFATLFFPSLLQFRRNKIILYWQEWRHPIQASYQSETSYILSSQTSLMQWHVVYDWWKRKTWANLFSNYIFLHKNLNPLSQYTQLLNMASQFKDSGQCGCRSAGGGGGIGMKRKNCCVRFCGNVFLHQLNPTSEPKWLRNWSK